MKEFIRENRVNRKKRRGYAAYYYNLFSPLSLTTPYVEYTKSFALFFRL